MGNSFIFNANETTAGTVWPFDQFDGTIVNVTDGNIDAQGLINIQESTSIDFIKNTMYSASFDSKPWIYYAVNDTELLVQGYSLSCLSGNDISGLFLTFVIVWLFF